MFQTLLAKARSEIARLKTRQFRLKDEVEQLKKQNKKRDELWPELVKELNKSVGYSFSTMDEWGKWANKTRVLLARAKKVT